MTPRRQQTSTPSGQPIRFYKLIALTFLFLTIILLGVIVFMSAKRATITIETKADPIDATGSIQVSDAAGIGSLQGIVTSTLVSITETYSPEGSRQIDAKAQGTVTMRNESSATQTLVANTRLLNADSVLFRLKNRVTVPANGTVEAEVLADVVGAGGNIGPAHFTIPGLAEAKQKLIYADSSAPMSGGTKTVGIFSIDDKKKAEKQTVDALTEAGKKVLEAQFSTMGAVFSLVQYTIEPDSEVGSEISSVSLKGQGTVIGVFYSQSDLQNFATNLIKARAVDDAEIIEPSKDGPIVSIDEYDLSKGTAKLKIFFSGLSQLNPESKQLDKSIFFDKSKEEISRYLRSLDHVRSVDVKFSPMWMMKVPPIPDHVSVVVKQVE